MRAADAGQALIIGGGTPEYRGRGEEESRCRLPRCDEL
jgi:hypothetical protein